MSHKVYSLNLSEENYHLLSKLVYSNENIEIVSLNNFDEILSLGENLSLKFLVLDTNTAPEFIIGQENRLSGKLLGTHLLWMVHGQEEKEKRDKLKIADHFSTQFFLPKDLSVIQKASLFFDYISVAAEPKIGKETSYIPLELLYLEKITKSPCDIFLKISDKKYVKIINRNDDFRISEIIEKYASKNIKEFYVTLDNIRSFKETFLKELFIDNKKESATSHQLRVTQAVLSIASDFGLNDYAIEGINQTFADIDKEFSSNSQFIALLEKLQRTEGSILSNHSYLTAVFISMIGQKTPWFNRDIKKNLFLAAVLHDLDLHGTGHEGHEFKTFSEINALPAKEREAIKNHPMTLASKLSKIDSIPSDVINLISKHHEGAGAESYPLGLHSPQLSPPNCLFNVAHQLSIEVSKIAFNMNKISLAIEKVRAHYIGNSMKPFIDSFEGQIVQQKAS